MVENREYRGHPVKVVIATRACDTSIDDLRDALTHPDRLKRWFAPVEGELKLGARFR